MHPSVLDRAPRRHEGLPGHLPAEHALTLFVGLDAPEDVDLNRFKVKQIDEKVQGGAHAPMFAGRRNVGHRARRGDRSYPAAA